MLVYLTLIQAGKLAYPVNVRVDLVDHLGQDDGVVAGHGGESAQDDGEENLEEHGQIDGLQEWLDNLNYYSQVNVCQADYGHFF